jgi:hypothetical protein
MISDIVSSIPSLTRVAAAAALVLTAAACDARGPVVPRPREQDIVWRLRTEERAVTLALDSSYQLTPRAFNLDRAPIDLSSLAIEYRSFDPSYVAVSAAGVLTAKQVTVGAPIEVYVTLNRDNVRREDTVLVNVTPTTQVVDSIGLSLLDSARKAILTPLFLFPSVYGANGISLFDVPVRLSIPDAGSTLVLGTLVLGLGPEEHWLYADATAYGHTFRDSVKITILNQSQIAVSMTDVEGGGIAVAPVDRLTIQPCGSIVWTNTSSEPLVVTLDVPANTGGCVAGDPAGGDVGAIQPGETIARKFPNVGTTHWTVARLASPTTIIATGTTVVK